jgi:uncharacterized FAD-dependent dehydrogenase
MKKNFTLQLSPEEAYDPDLFKEVVLKKAGVSATTPQTFARQTRRSIDARSRKVLVNVEAELFVSETPGSLLDHFPTYENVAHADPILIVGAGPAGLFAALRAIELGVKPILLERGKDVRARRRDLAAINKEGIVHPDSNQGASQHPSGLRTVPIAAKTAHQTSQSHLQHCPSQASSHPR